MISRKSTRVLSEIYEVRFTLPATILRPKATIKKDELYNFLYERDYDPAFMKTVEQWGQSATSLSYGIKRIHTGESLYSITINWTEERRTIEAQNLLRKLAADIIRLYELTARPVQSETPIFDEQFAKMHRDIFEGLLKPFRMVEWLKKNLELDGYVYRDGNLYSNEGGVIQEKEEQTILELLVTKLGLDDKEIILHHLKLSEDDYLSGKWGNSISNSRHFLEAILQSIAHTIHTKLSLPNAEPDRPYKVRDFLESQGLIDQTEKKALSENYGLLSHTGGHPNIAEQDEARLMRHLGLTFAQYMLLTLEKYLEKNP